jgi:thiamine monophosphate kinase
MGLLPSSEGAGCFTSDATTQEQEKTKQKIRLQFIRSISTFLSDLPFALQLPEDFRLVFSVEKRCRKSLQLPAQAQKAKKNRLFPEIFN